MVQKKEKERSLSKTSRPFGRIQKRILFLTVSCLFGMCLIISFASYYIFQKYLQHSLIQSTETNLKLLTDTINGSMDNVYLMVRFLQTNSEVAEYIENNPNPGSVLSVSTYERINEEYNNNASNAYMPRVAVITSDHFLQIVSASYSSTSDLAQEVPKLSFFQELLEDTSYNFSTGLINDPFYRKGRAVLPIIRPITYQYNSVQGGYLFIEVSTELFASPLRRYNVAEDSNIYLTLGDHNYVYREGAFEELDGSYEMLKDLTESAITDNIRVTKIRTSDSRNRIVVTSALNMPDCYISQSISHSELFNQQLLWWAILAGILIGILGIGILLMIILNRMIHVPVFKLQAKMLRIADGDFSRDPSIEWNHELGDIGRGINDLSEDVYLLMNKRIEDEKQKRDLEYKMLQSQINPHFLYNTLNSIKWMATIQGACGIAEMTTALSRLLKSVSKGTSLLIPIREELSLVENYFTIQSYRYGGTLSLEIHVEEDFIYDCEIIKFTLQPLVENAIFHGIEPKGTTGRITINAFCEKKAEDSPDGLPQLCIDITDDGVGISPDKAQQILVDNQESSTDFFREIGVSNVHKRLQYEFGESYGITIASEEGAYTTMSIHIPGRRAGRKD